MIRLYKDGKCSKTFCTPSFRRLFISLALVAISSVSCRSQQTVRCVRESIAMTMVAVWRCAFTATPVLNLGINGTIGHSGFPFDVSCVALVSSLMCHVSCVLWLGRLCPSLHQVTLHPALPLSPACTLPVLSFCGLTLIVGAPENLSLLFAFAMSFV